MTEKEKKFILLISFLLFTCVWALADGPAYVPVHVEIETVDGKNVKVWVKYQVIRDFSEIDSLRSEAFFLKNFVQRDRDSAWTSFYYFKHRIRYEFDTSVWGGKPVRAVVSMMLDGGEMEYKNIKDVKILEVIDLRDENNSENFFALYIENSLNISDTVWFKTPVIQKIKFIGDGCEFDILIHEQDMETDLLLEKMTAMEQSRDKSIDRDMEMFDLVQSIKGMKVVVLVGPCLC